VPDSAHGAFSGPVFLSESVPSLNVFCLYEASPFLSVVPLPGKFFEPYPVRSPLCLGLLRPSVVPSDPRTSACFSRLQSRAGFHVRLLSFRCTGLPGCEAWTAWGGDRQGDFSGRFAASGLQY